MPFLLALLLCLGLAACGSSAPVSRFATEDVSWVLTELDGMPFTAHAVLTFVADGLLKGEAPCNGFSARISEPKPWFRILDLTRTERGCTELAEEMRFFTALDEMTLAQRLEDQLVLTSAEGREMVFHRAGR